MVKSLKEFTNLDFLDIKESLKTFLQQQAEFQDYDFEGSNLNVLLDLLAYNTQYNAFYGNMWFTEHFLDVAQLRSSVVGLARNLGYVPRSARSAFATIDVEITPVGGFGGGSIIIPAGTQFSGTNSAGDSFLFQTDVEIIVPEVTGTWNTQLTIYEGSFFRFAEVIANGENGVVIPNKDVDTERLNVFVKDSVGASTSTQYDLNTDYTQVQSGDTVYFIQEVEDEKHRIYFGDGVIGSPVVDGNVVEVEYYMVAGSAANGINVFSLESSITDVDSVSVTTVAASSGGREVEDIEAVRTAAPLFYQTQNRAVTAADYQAIILDNFTNVEDAIAWGGEDNVPVDYGKVYISMKPVTGLTLSQTEKDNIEAFLIANYSIVSIIPVSVDPRYVNASVTVEAFYDSTKTNPGGVQIQTDIVNAIKSFSNTNLEKFGKNLQYSRLVRAVDDANTSIINSNTEVSIQLVIGDMVDILANDYSFFNGIKPDSLTSSLFQYDGTPFAFFTDDGVGQLRLFYLDGGAPVEFSPAVIAGSIDYVTGNITFDFNEFDTSLVVLTNGDIVFTAQTDSFDIEVIRNQIVIIEDTDINVVVTDTSTGLTYEGA